jgi:cysteine synthase
MIDKGQAEIFLALEVEIKRTLGHAGRVQDFLQARGGVALMVDDAPADIENVFTRGGGHAAQNRPVVYYCQHGGPIGNARRSRNWGGPCPWGAFGLGSGPSHSIQQQVWTMIHPSILTLVGATPIVALNRVYSHPRIRIAAKLEAKSIGGSIKDRVALAMIEAAEASGELTPDKTVIEPTSGNTGVGLAMICAVKGYKLTLLMPDSASEERQRIMRAYGAELRLTPGRLGTGRASRSLPSAREPQTYVPWTSTTTRQHRGHYLGTAGNREQTEGRAHVSPSGTSHGHGIAKRMKDRASGPRWPWTYPGTRSRGSRTCRNPIHQPSMKKPWTDHACRGRGRLRVPRRLARERAS